MEESIFPQRESSSSRVITVAPTLINLSSQMKRNEVRGAWHIDKAQACHKLAAQRSAQPQILLLRPEEKRSWKVLRFRELGFNSYSPNYEYIGYKFRIEL
ncbi:hypothetical protein CDAR_84581 [Caerostris darwini]|uniref:Uncharacterized protein n=1 Tax=Caerostris darwini TaxID=1538125 RepID=A0AAV4RP94_9ARAC|nr:hypothetical protein CDAR_84581 [Caerostris darwini]